jgi:hypothetical protein
MTSLEDKFLRMFNKKGYQSKLAKLAAEEEFEKDRLADMKRYEDKKNNILKEMEIYQKRYGNNLEEENLFELIFKNEEISDIFYDFYVLKSYSKDWLSIKLTVKELYAKNIKLTPKTIGNLIADKNIFYIPYNESFSIETLNYILTTHKSNLSDYEINCMIKSASMKITFDPTTLIENSDIFNMETIAECNGTLDLETITYLLENKYEVDNAFRKIKGITLDYVKKYEEHINIYSLSVNKHIDKDIVNYLIKNHSDKIEWKILSQNHNLLANIETKDGLKHQAPLHHLINNF